MEKATSEDLALPSFVRREEELGPREEELGPGLPKLNTSLDIN